MVKTNMEEKVSMRAFFWTVGLLCSAIVAFAGYSVNVDNTIISRSERNWNRDVIAMAQVRKDINTRIVKEAIHNEHYLMLIQGQQKIDGKLDTVLDKQKENAIKIQKLEWLQKQHDKQQETE